ncbi:MAG: hypothetical protein GYB49_13060 [Alphaproteobacteria bacterium]|nr:hypothetical protein [Hyphomonas sp.]MBR9808140.1 hypothetical protein [Alphaproteobacteria bacterium]|tara:strand:+ start:829 stop:2292 length:1464 start_codon:yes stop_codon:yes gene_type:complete
MTSLQPIAFSQAYGISSQAMMKAKVFDPLLNADTKLFVDPLLLPISSAEEISDQASDLFQDHFSNVFKLLSHSKRTDDVAWKGAKALLDYKEVPYTCIGYGSSSIRGSSLSEEKKSDILELAKEIADLGVIDPYLLPLLSLLEPGIGPDNISDMVTGIAYPAICAFTENTCKELKVPLEEFYLDGKKYQLPRNLAQRDKNMPVLLLPLDILKHLPVASDWNDVCDIATQNEDLRRQVNQRIGQIFRDTALTEQEKARARVAIFRNKAALELIAEALKSKSLKPYDFTRDPHGFLLLQAISDSLPKQVPLQAVAANLKTPKDTVVAILDQFKLLIEKHGYWKELWTGERFKNESALQRMLYLVAYSYAEANDLDVSPEVDLSSGRIDFKFSKGADKIIVEIKKSSNGHLVSGVRSQLQFYCQAENSKLGYYLVADHSDKQDTWLQKLVDEANAVRKETKINIEIFVIDANKQSPPSKGGGRKKTKKKN